MRHGPRRGRTAAAYRDEPRAPIRRRAHAVARLAAIAIRADSALTKTVEGVIGAVGQDRLDALVEPAQQHGDYQGECGRHPHPAVVLRTLAEGVKTATMPYSKRWVRSSGLPLILSTANP